MEFYFKLEKSYTDITCKNSNGHIEFFVLNPEAAKIERICRGSFNKLEKQELPSEQVQHLLKNAVALKYDAKNNLLLVLSSELEQFTMLSCGLEVIHRCHTVSELRSFTIDSEGSIICLRQPK